MKINTEEQHIYHRPAWIHNSLVNELNGLDISEG